MSVMDIVIVCMTALEANELGTAARNLDDNFFFGGWTPETLDKSQFLDLMSELKAGIPDLVFNAGDFVEVENTNTVQCHMQMEGTQSDRLDLSVLRIAPVPPTGRRFSLPRENVVYVVENNLITRMTVTPIEGGSVQGLLRQLGVESLHYR